MVHKICPIIWKRIFIMLIPLLGIGCTIILISDLIRCFKSDLTSLHILQKKQIPKVLYIYSFTHTHTHTFLIRLFAPLVVQCFCTFGPQRSEIISLRFKHNDWSVMQVPADKNNKPHLPVLIQIKYVSHDTQCFRCLDVRCLLSEFLSKSLTLATGHCGIISTPTPIPSS